MAADIISVDAQSPDSMALEQAAAALAEGALVVFPTETVYGLAANAAIASSVERLREVKGRSQAQPFTVHVGRGEDCEAFVPCVGPMGRRFMRKGWPGPLTLIFKVGDPASAEIYDRLCDVGAAAIYDNNAVGVRFPDHAVAASLLDLADAPIIASSANAAGGRAPIEVADIPPEVTDQIDLILDAGPTRYRKSSTIVSLDDNGGYQVIREGVWDERTIRRLAVLNILFVCTGNTCRSPVAEGLCKKALADRLGCTIEELPERGIHVSSAGTLGYSGAPVSAESVDVCRTRGIDISGHKSRGLTPELLNPADHVFTMARHHLDAVRAVSPESARRASLLSNEDIPDPIGAGLDEYERVAKLIGAALEERLQEVDV